jgi:hypothetical protein
MVSWLYFFGSQTRQNIMAEKVWCSTAAHLMIARKWREKEREWGWGGERCVREREGRREGEREKGGGEMSQYHFKGMLSMI